MLRPGAQGDEGRPARRAQGRMSRLSAHHAPRDVTFITGSVATTALIRHCRSGDLTLKGWIGLTRHDPPLFSQTQGSVRLRRRPQPANAGRGTSGLRHEAEARGRDESPDARPRSPTSVVDETGEFCSWRQQAGVARHPPPGRRVGGSARQCYDLDPQIAAGGGRGGCGGRGGPLSIPHYGSMSDGAA